MTSRVVLINISLSRKRFAPQPFSYQDILDGVQICFCVVVNALVRGKLLRLATFPVCDPVHYCDWLVFQKGGASEEHTG